MCPCPQVTIVIKYFFQFGFFPFNQKLEVDRSKPFHPPNILGVEKKEGYVLYDLLQLLTLFYHRATLKVKITSYSTTEPHSRSKSQVILPQSHTQGQNHKLFYRRTELEVKTLNYNSWLLLHSATDSGIRPSAWKPTPSVNTTRRTLLTVPPPVTGSTSPARSDGEAGDERAPAPPSCALLQVEL